jgi:hypothetical protein
MTRLLFPVAAAAVLLAGCRGGPDVRKTFPVSGTLTVNGAPAEPGILVLLTPQFTETDKYPIHPRGLTLEGGGFKVTTYNSDDGAPEGEYVATVEWPRTGGLSSYASGDLFGGAFANPETNKANPQFKVNVTRDGAKLKLDLAVTPAQLKAIEAAKAKSSKAAVGFNLSGQ